MKLAKKEDINIKEAYGSNCISSVSEFISNNNLNLNGLDSEKSIKNQTFFGKNEIKQAKPRKWYNFLFGSLFSPFNLILLGISFILIYTDIILPENPSPANIIVIFTLVTISTLLEFIQEYRSNKAADKLKEMVATTTTILREGCKTQIPNKEITIGDIVILSAGDMIPADLRIIEAKDLYVGQSSITGESDAVKKLDTSELNSIDDLESITDLDTICFMGTNVISGSAKGAVIKIGDNTYFGRVADTLNVGKPKTSFETRNCKYK